jgi:hypothetical protein
MYSILLFVQSKEMPRKTRKRSKGRRRTIRRKRGGSATTQPLIIPTKSLQASEGGVNSVNSWYGI